MKEILTLVLLAFIASMADASPLEEIQATAKKLNSSEEAFDISLSSEMNVTTEGNETVAFQKIGGMEFSSTSRMTNLTDGLKSSVS